MPQIIALKFSPEEAARYYLPGPLASEIIHPQDFCIAIREDEEEVGYVAGIEHWCCGQFDRVDTLPSLIRRANDSEVGKWWEYKAFERRAMEVCKAKVVEHNLPMKVSMVHYEASNNKMAFQFTSDKRVDFRALVRDLAALLHCRIELWQIGVREEARVLDGFGVCGLNTCCSAWMDDFKPVTLKMAKDQDIDLPPAKLTGQCGRLLCCLSYEVEAYRDLSREALPRGTSIVHAAGKGVIVDRNLIQNTYVVSDDAGVLTTIAPSTIREFTLPEPMKHMEKKFASFLSAAAMEDEEDAAETQKASAQVIEEAEEESRQSFSEESDSEPERKSEGRSGSDGRDRDSHRPRRRGRGGRRGRSGGGGAGEHKSRE